MAKIVPRKIVEFYLRRKIEKASYESFWGTFFPQKDSYYTFFKKLVESIRNHYLTYKKNYSVTFWIKDAATFKKTHLISFSVTSGIIYFFLVIVYKKILKFQFYESVIKILENTKNVGYFCGDQNFFAIKTFFWIYFIDCSRKLDFLPLLLRNHYKNILLNSFFANLTVPGKKFS